VRRHSLVAWAGSVVTGLLVVTTVTLAVLTPTDRLPEDLRPGPSWLLIPLYPLVLAAVGTLIASRRPENSIGWLMCGAAMLGALVELGRYYSYYSLAAGRPGLFGVEWVAWLARWVWLPWLMLQLVYLPVLFPDGKLPSRRWAWLVWTASITALVGITGRALNPGLLADVRLRNPVAIPDAQVDFQRLAGIALLVLMGLALASLASVFFRLRTATGDRRQQLKWFGSAITVLVTLVTAGTIADEVGDVNSPPLEVLVASAYPIIPIVVGFSVLRYRLYDIDLVINRTLVYGALVAFISAVYLIAVVGVGALVGIGNHVNLLLPLVAAGVVALAFQPVRQWLQRLANKLVYGRRATPYDALAVLSRRVAETAPGEQLLKDSVRALCDAIGIPSASVWLRGGQEWRAVAQWPPDGQGPPPAPSMADARRRGARVFSVHNQGALLGAISVIVPPGRTLSPADERLLGDVASQAGLLLRNMGLTADLMDRLGELQESRRRLVTAQEEERRRLERNLHDGAQQDLFSLKLDIRRLRHLVRRAPTEVEAALERLEEQAEKALQTVKELARGVYPPLLTAQGISAALSARARAAPVDVRISSAGVERYPAGVEEAVYFCCAEALQNAVRHARPTSVRISLEGRGDELFFHVEDDGRGFDLAAAAGGAGLQSMRDRVDVVGGTLEIVSSEEAGTTVRGRVQIPSHARTRLDGYAAEDGAAAPPRESVASLGHGPPHERIDALSRSDIAVFPAGST
jgi:signal transduction histidine kinase